MDKNNVNPSKVKAIVLVSGGVDSAVCLAIAVDKYGKDNVTALTLYYGQKHDKEVLCAQNLTAHYGVKHLIKDLSEVFSFSDCPLLQGQGEIPHESYANQLGSTTGTVSTYVPFRNGLFLAYAAAIAYSIGAFAVYYGAHADDAAGRAYPDCTPEFRNAMSEAIFTGTGDKVQMFAPLITFNKTRIVGWGLELKVPFHLTWSCYEGQEHACGVCGTCRDRKAAFIANGVNDPITYKE